MYDVDPVREEVRHGAAAEIPKPAPEAVFFFRERLIGRGAEPLFPIEQVGLDGLVRMLVLVILLPIGADLRDAPDVSTLDQFDRALKVNPASLLHSALQNTIRLMHGLGKIDAFGD